MKRFSTTANKLFRVLIVTSEWPAFPGDCSGIHIVNQVEALKRQGVSADVFHFRGKGNPFIYFAAILRLLRMNLREFDLIHAHHGQSGIVALAQSRLPVVVTFHGSDLQGISDGNGSITIKGRILQFISRYLVARKANEVIIVSEHMRKLLPKRTYYVIPAGINLNLFNTMPREEVRKLLGLSLDRHLILFVGDPRRPEKRYSLAKAAIGLLDSNREADLIVAHGIEYSKMPLYMNACDVLLVTSSSEGSPNTIKEALSCNLPIVSTDVGDIKKRIASIVGCVVCDNDSPETIADGLSRVLKTSTRITGRTHVVDLEEDLLVRKLIDIYKKTVN